MAFANTVKFTAGSSGTSDFSDGTAATSFRNLSGGAVNGQTYSYRAVSADGSQWENGQGVYTSGSPGSIARTTIFESSTGSKVSFTAAPTVWLTPLKADLDALAPTTSGQTLVSFGPYDNEPPASTYATLDLRNGHPVLVFADAIVAIAIFSGVMPRRYGGGGVTVYINWMSDTTSTNKACLSATLERMDVGTTDLDADSFGTQVIDTTGVAGNATSGIQSQTAIALTSGAQMDSVGAGNSFRLKITRETAQANDTLAANLQIASIEVKET